MIWSCDEEPTGAVNLRGRDLQQFEAVFPAALAEELDVPVRDRESRVHDADALIHLLQEKPLPLLVALHRDPFRCQETERSF